MAHATKGSSHGEVKMFLDSCMQICEANRVLKPGGVAFFGMVNRDEGTFLGPYFRNETWWPTIAQRCGFESVSTTSNFTEWRGGPARYHAYLKKGKEFIDELRDMLTPTQAASGNAKNVKPELITDRNKKKTSKWKRPKDSIKK